VLEDLCGVLSLAKPEFTPISQVDVTLEHATVGPLSLRERARVRGFSADDAFFDQQLEDGFGAGLGGDAFEHLPTAATGFGGRGFHAVGAAFGFDHLQAFGPRLGRLQLATDSNSSSTTSMSSACKTPRRAGP
jgi:hypothetical protein